MKWLNFKNIILFLLLIIMVLAVVIIKPIAETELKKIIAKEVLKFDDIKDFDLNDVKIGLLPPKVEFNNVDLLLKKYKELKKIYIQKIKIYPEILTLLSLEFRLKDIYVSGLELKIEDSAQEQKKQDFKFNFDELYGLPIKSIYIEDSKINYNKSFLNIGYFQIKKKWSHFEVHSDLNKLKVNDETPTIRVNRLSLNIYEDLVQLKHISLISEDSNLQVGLEIKKPFNERILNLNIIESTDIRLSSRLNLANFKFLLEKYLKLKIKNISGVTQLLLYKAADKKANQVEYTLQGENIEFDNYYLEDISSNGQIQPDLLTVNHLKINNKNLNVESKSLKISKKNKSYNAKLNGEITSTEIGGFLSQNLKLKEVPINIPGRFNYDCTGPIYPKAELNCEVDGEIKSLHIWSDSKRVKETTVVKLPESKIKGNAVIFNKSMTFSSFHEFKSSQVEFVGTVDFVRGFNVSYNSDFFNFSDVISLANIPISGFGNIKGTTRGSSKWGEFNLHADLSDFNFFKYRLGQVVSDVSYKSQNLYFTNTRSNIGNSLLLGKIDFNLKKSYIKVEANSDKATITDILYAIKDIAEPPIYLSGEGAVQLKAEGPLKLGQMTYDIQANFKEGLIYKDRYKNLKININSLEGQVKTQNSLSYLGDTINVEGLVDPEGIVDIIVMGDSINLSRINAIKDLGLQLSGLAQVQMHLTDFILLPEVNGHFKSANVIEDYAQIGSSDFNFAIHKNYSEIKGELFNSSLSGNAKIPHSYEGPFEAKLNLTKFDPFKFMTLFDSKISKVGSNTAVSGKVNLQAPSFNIKKINGDVELSELQFRAERNNLTLKYPSLIKVNKGIPSGIVEFVDNQSNNLYLFLSEANNFIKGQVSLGFLRTLVPEVEEIQGDIALETHFMFQPHFKFLSGSGSIQNLSLKIENLVHSFKDIYADLGFYQENVELKNIKGSFANGLITGDGKVFFANGIGVDIKGTAERLSLNIPDGFKSLASGNYTFTGNGFPYTLGGDFKILEGLFEMEFTSDSSQQFVILPSRLLPKSKLAASPLDLNINVKSQKPIVIDNSYVDGSAAATLNITGQPSLPIFVGQIRLNNDSKLIFQNNKFNVNSGLITFNGVSPEQGHLNIDANARIKDFVDILEREYDIRMLIQGTGANPQLSFSSQPTLTEPQILSFLAFGMLEPNTLNREITLGDQQAQTGYQIGGIFLKNKFAKDIQDRLGLQFNFTSSYENQDVSPKFIVEKKFNSKFSLSGSRNLGTFQKNTVRGEYKINKKLSIIGLYENYDLDNDATLNRARLVDGENVLGMDLQYNIEFQ